MKKSLLVLGLVFVLIASVFMLSACQKGTVEQTSTYGKEVNTYTIERDDGAGKMTFEFAKDLGYEGETESTSRIKLENSENLSKISVAFYHDYKTSSNITKTEKSFYSEDYHDFKEVEKSGYKGWEIWKTTSLINNYEVCLVLADSNEANKVYAVDITVEKSPLEDGQAFDTNAFVESEDFNHIIESIKLEAASAEEIEEANKVPQASGEFAERTDGYSDKDGLIFIKSFESPNPELYKAEQRNDNVGIDNYLWNLDEKAQFETSGIEVRIFPKTGTFASMDAYKEKKGSMYTWDKATIDGKEYDIYKFANSTKPSKYSDYYSGAFLVGDKVVEFSYNMYAEVKDQDLGPKFFTQIVNSIEYSKKFKGE